MPIFNPPEDTGTPGQPISEVETVQGVQGGYPLAVTGSLAATFTPVASSVAADVSFSASLSNQVLAAADPTRLGISVFVSLDCGGHLYLRMGAAATTSSYSNVLWPGSLWEAPYGFTGQVNGVFDTLTGSCRVTRFN